MAMTMFRTHLPEIFILSRKWKIVAEDLTSKINEDLVHRVWGIHPKCVDYTIGQHSYTRNMVHV